MEFRKALVVIVWQPKPGAKEKKVLVLRLISERGGFWQPVTGKVEEGESYAEGALREATEESGLLFDRVPQFLGLEHNFPGRGGRVVRELSFFLPIFGGSSPPTPVLDGKEHVAFEWLDPAEAAVRVKFPGNREAIERATSGTSPLFLTSRGSFYQDGEEVTHARTVELLHRSLIRVDSGYAVRVAGEELDVVVESCARFVSGFDRSSGFVSVLFSEGEKLDPSSLRICEDNSLTCVLASGWKAVFLPPAYYEISKDIREGSVPGEYVLNFLGRDHLLAVAD